ncbi:glycoside hydrolase superfamily [Pseudomassariella vexata]|uniref:mannan endo-1,4-beta-mannosidase n=1 Tax=Pseudomassariella vexata TaxID=1141098 RepID=A0A1Y2E501_9PEZI|nr:glycoside hydrolase superfamily [Pseudomassariella vexata]ORY65935.1 glycoside hydrolase superfamily [Pseudomassariella vexata]
MRKGSLLLANDRPWKAVGPNVYWLGLDENVVPPAGEPYDAATKSSYPTKGRITDVMATVQALGGTMIRTHTLGVSVGNPLSVMPKLGVINEAAFEAIDWAVYQAGLFGIRLMVPLVDNYDYYHGGKYTFLRWAGLSLTQNQDSNNPAIQQFYTNATIVASFKDYIQKLVTHKNQYNGLTYAEDPTIFAYETGNELSGPVWGDMNCPGSWVEDIVKFVKGLAPAKLFVDGTYGINKTHLGIEEADIFSDHFYPVDTTKLRQGIAAVGGASKAYFAGEYDWIGGQAENLASFFDIIEKSSMACGDTFWSLFGRNLPNCSAFVNHNDGLTMQYGNPANSAQVNSRIQLIRKHGTAMSVGTDIGANATLPSVPCPAPSPR